MIRKKLIQYCVISLSLLFGLQAGLPTAFAADQSDFRSHAIILLVGSHHALVKKEMKQMTAVPKVVNETTLVPIRFISEQFGAKVSWNGQDQRIELQNQTSKVLIQIGSTDMLVSGKSVTLNVAPQIIGESTYIPLRAVSEALDKRVDYENGLILLSDNSNDAFASVDEDVKDLLVNQLSPQKIAINFTAEPQLLDSSKATANASFTFINLFNEGLYRMNEAGQLTPALAQAQPLISKDGLTYTIQLRDGLEWSDGAPLTAQDFVYSIQRTKNPRTKAQYSFMADWIDQIEAPDEHTLIIKLFEPRPQMTQLLAFAIFFPQRQDVVESQGDQYGKEAGTVVGAGPFILKKWEHGKGLTFERNPRYWDAENIQPDQVSINLSSNVYEGANQFIKGTTDVTEINRDIADIIPKKLMVTKYELTNSYVMFQERKVPAFANANIRKALALAIDRKNLIREIMTNGSVEATGLVPAGTSDGNRGEFRKTAGDALPPYSPDDAKKLLEKGLEELGLESLPPFTLISDDTTTARRINAYIVGNWKKILGIQASSLPIAHAERVSKQGEHDYEAALGLWGADYNDPMTFMEMYKTDGTFNEVDYSNKAYDVLLLAANKEVDGAKRAQMLVEAEKLLLDEMPVAPLYFRSRIYLKNQQVKGMFLPSFSYEWEIRWASKPFSPTN
ncbi:oligopeptide transport system substrate-binding protein [Paenibacillus sp. V4I3]|uniref:ABC transporter substrate-binding protein n=1 Tax=Paenibacillus sp. V4I3 TaxID=3042305 RepID=UPI00277D790D|nr:ABC transporter substrate-binding protein [Paenibacillus sp. V4I3]MDQ0872442.1 oligopeptide transport system substrate-binding protein [Paenibacillus sp. V4I3]